MIEKMNSEKFRWDNSARATYISITLLWDVDEAEPIAKVLGYCNGDLVSTVAKPDCYVVMFDLDGEEVWTHLPKTNFERWQQKNSG
jgi:aminoglycoside phosphotransferase (APT) family kinase protein